MRRIRDRCATFAILVLVFALVACGGGDSSNPPPSPAPVQPVQPPALTGTPDQNADALIAIMTTDEKIQLVHGTGYTGGSEPRGAAGYVPGIAHLNIPDIYLADGSVGVGNSVGQATALPSSIASAASWDPIEAYKYGQVIGAESKALGMNVNLGGNVNLIGREPRCGRTFETGGEDPVLAGRIKAQHLKAIQDQKVIAGIKHFALNDQETSRFTADVQIDERGARESDLLAFEIGVKDSGVQSVMCSYNLIGGTYACENSHLLTEILKNEWGFQGFVMSDWDGTHSTVKAATAGLDQEQPGSGYFEGVKDEGIKQAIQDGHMQASVLDNMVHRILRAMFAVGAYQHPTQVASIDAAADAAIAQEMEEQGAVLLKNSASQLPLSKSVRSIAVIGSHADIAVPSGGGSAQVTPVGGPAISNPAPCPPCWGNVVWDPSSPLKAIQAKVPSAIVKFDDGTSTTSATALAAASDVAIVFVSQWESEGMDLPDLSFSGNQDALVAAVAAANPHTVVVIESGGAQVMPWLANVNAVLEAWYPGQRGGEAIANLLFGDVNPSGKLPITFPASVNDLPHPTIAAPPANSTAPFPVTYDESFLVGYKYYDANSITPLFPFGFGLSYTTFTLTNPQLTPASPVANGFSVSVDVNNTGAVAGAEVVQVYLGLPVSTGESPKRLVGWQKVSVQPGQTQNVTVPVDASSSAHPLSYWDSTAGAWQIANGDYTVYVGNSSRNVTVAGTFHIGP
jgi:beta-glucosidase